MKPVPRADYSVSGRAYSAEYLGAKERMRGAYWVELNAIVTLAFVPRLPCHPELLRWPDDVDVPATDDEAMAVLALSNMYVVVADDWRAGQAMRLPPSAGNDGASPVFFFVARPEWEHLIANVRCAAQLTHGYQPSVHYRDEFPDLASFVERRVIGSDLLDSYSRAFLADPERAKAGVSEGEP